MTANIDRILSQLEEFDTDPPDENYTHGEFGERAASECDPDTARKLVVACYMRLLNSLAASFLDGFLKVVKIEALDDLLFACMVSSPDINAAGSIVGYLLNICRAQRN